MGEKNDTFQKNIPRKIKGAAEHGLVLKEELTSIQELDEIRLQIALNEEQCKSLISFRRRVIYSIIYKISILMPLAGLGATIYGLIETAKLINLVDSKPLINKEVLMFSFVCGCIFIALLIISSAYKNYKEWKKAVELMDKQSSTLLLAKKLVAQKEEQVLNLKSVERA